MRKIRVQLKVHTISEEDKMKLRNELEALRQIEKIENFKTEIKESKLK